MKSARPTKMTGPIGFLLVALPLLVAVGHNARPRPAMDVQCGDVLDVDYGQYRLNGDLVCPNNPSRAAVTITGEGVHFNLAGHTLTRDDASGGFLLAGILVRGAHAHINNGSVVDINCPHEFLNREDCAGIFLGEAPGVRINGMSLHNNTVGIITFSSGSYLGGVVGNADGARIQGNDITGNLRIGIILTDFGGATAEGARIIGNDLSDTGGYPGFGQGYIGSTRDNVSVIGNVANNCAYTGILLSGTEDEGPAEHYTIRGNTTLDNGFAGILLLAASAEAFRPHDNLIHSNTAFGNGVFDLGEVLFLPVPFEVIPFDDCLNTWKDNDFDVATADCVE